MQAGDVIFLRPGADKIGQFVARQTQGPYCHVQILMSSSFVLEAVAWNGVQASILTQQPSPEDCTTLAEALEPDRLQHAVNWVTAQIGHPYSLWDILADGVQTVFPFLSHAQAPFLVSPSAYDCSSLAARFLALAGYKWLPDTMFTDPMQVSPNSLARALGVFK